MIRAFRRDDQWVNANRVGVYDGDRLVADFGWPLARLRARLYVARRSSKRPSPGDYGKGRS